MKEEIIYFSLNKKRKKSFYDYIKGNKICYKPKFSFHLIGDDVEFDDPRDLLPIIEGNKQKDSLHIIIDYISCCKGDDFKNYSMVIRDIIMAYPEIQFLFDETFVHRMDTKTTEELPKKQATISDLCFLNFLFPLPGDRIGKDGVVISYYDEEGKIEDYFNILKEFHQFDLNDFTDKTIEEQFIRLLKGCNNVYDGSNLRCAIKACKFESLHVKNNFRKVTDSRRDNLAIVVEEEYQQAMFNGYCLHANGFRVIPVLTATELVWMNKDNINFGGKAIVIRDYDLQFLDEKEVEKNILEPKVFGINEIDYIRGAKYCKGKFTLIPDQNDTRNPYWGDKLPKNNTYFVSKGGDNIDIKLDIPEESRPISLPSVNESKLKLYGIKKPVEGIYSSIHKFEEIEKRYQDTLYKDSDDIDYVIDIKRQGDDGHSCPLDIYGIARSMVHRAELYYFFKRYRLAALVAGEALELLNGFHNSLMKQAYYLQAISENAMAMSLLGGEEEVLCEDLILRLKHKVKRDVDRLVRDKEDRRNLLMNIYNDCRLFCREKEYLRAADYALSIMMYEKEGLSFKKIIDFFNSSKCKKSFKQTNNQQ